MIPNVLSIAGSDPSGGAGIQADLKTFSACGVYGMAVVTALTAQNTHGVTGIHFVPPGFVAEQIETVLADVRVDAIKIGMVGNAEAAAAIAAVLSKGSASLVLDPVMVAKGGAMLLDEPAIGALRSRLLPLSSLLTPNLPEAAVLLGEPVAASRPAMLAQGHRLLALGPAAVLMKGGHLGTAESPDVLVTADEAIWFEAARQATGNTHGTGCTLSSAIAAELAKGGLPRQAIGQAKAFLSGAIGAADQLSVGSGHGPVQHFFGLWRQADAAGGSPTQGGKQ